MEVDLRMLLEAWGVQYLIVGTISWLLWFWLGSHVQRDNLPRILAYALPLSFIVSIGEEMLWVFCFPS